MITSTSNQQMKNLTLLMKKAKARNEQGVFVAEGRKMFLEAPVEWVKQVYVSESFYGTCTQGNMQDCMESCTPKHGEEKLNRKVLERLNETGYEIVSDNVFKSVSDTQTPQGILCVIKKPEYASRGNAQRGTDTSSDLREHPGSGKSRHDGAHR